MYHPIYLGLFPIHDVSRFSYVKRIIKAIIRLPFLSINETRSVEVEIHFLKVLSIAKNVKSCKLIFK